MKTHNHRSRRGFLASAGKTALAATALRSGLAWAAELDPRVAAIVTGTVGIDTHNHIDVPMTAAAQPGPDLDFVCEMKRSGLSAICATFATDYQPGDPYERFHQAMQALDLQLDRSKVRRSLTASEIEAAHRQQQPTVIQAIEGGHFLEGHLERVEEAYRRGLRHFGLLHDSDASTPLGDVYTNPPRLGGLTAFGAAVIKECNRLGMLVDVAHASMQTTEAALRISSKPVMISHTGLDSQLGSDARMAQMMRPRLISKEQATLVADAGGVVGVWTHLADTPLDYARNIRALVEVIGVDHVAIGTDTKLTQPTPRGFGPPPGGLTPGGGSAPKGQDEQSGPPPGFRPGQRHAQVGERTNMAWENESSGFYYAVVDAMLKTGFSKEEIGKIGGGNYLRIFGKATRT